MTEEAYDFAFFAATFFIITTIAYLVKRISKNEHTKQGADMIYGGLRWPTLVCILIFIYLLVKPKLFTEQQVVDA
jgi:hypothetical protein